MGEWLELGLVAAVSAGSFGGAAVAAKEQSSFMTVLFGLTGVITALVAVTQLMINLRTLGITH